MDETKPDTSAAQTLGRLEGAVDGLKAAVTRIETALVAQAGKFTDWQQEMVRLQERTKIRAVIATILSVAVPSALVLALYIMGFLRKGGQ